MAKTCRHGIRARSSVQPPMQDRPGYQQRGGGANIDIPLSSLRIMGRYDTHRASQAGSGAVRPRRAVGL